MDEHYDDGGRPSAISIARHAAELVRGPSRAASEIRDEVLKSAKDFEIRIKWTLCSDSPTTVDIRLCKQPVLHADLDPGWQSDDTKIKAEFIADDDSWAERFIQIDCGYVTPSIAPIERAALSPVRGFAAPGPRRWRLFRMV